MDKPTIPDRAEGFSDVEDHSEEEDEDIEEPIQQDTGLYSCPFEGCVKTFQRYLNLEHHMSYGKCKLQPEKRTLLDKAKVLYQRKLLEGASKQPVLSVATQPNQQTSVAIIREGWALKTSKSTKRFSDNQTRYLDEKFAIGQDTGNKADPEQVARDMRRARTERGTRRFTYEEFLSAKQIKAYFSRSAAKKKSVQTAADDQASEDQSEYVSARQHILQECQIKHPIICDTYNICKLYAKNKLRQRLSVALLRHICEYFGLNIEGLTESRKDPYIRLISQLVHGCSCGGKDN